MRLWQQFRNVLWIYLRNPFFLTLAGLFMLGAVVSKWMIHHGQNIIGNDICTLLFVVTLWLACILGVILKRQIANHRAHIVPGYRQPHILGLVFLYAVFILVIYFWEQGMRLDIAYTPNGILGIYLLCWLVAILITYMGYLSIGRLLIYAYLITLFLSNKAAGIVIFLNENPTVNYYLAGGVLVASILFIARLLRLKEDMFEYHSLLSWPPKNLIQNQMHTDSKVKSWLGFWLPGGTGPAPSLSIQKYYALHKLEERILHWLFFEEKEFKKVSYFLIGLTPFYLILIAMFSSSHDFFATPYNNFLLLTAGPILLLISIHYKKMLYWKYELLRPVRRQDFIVERGLGLLGSLEIMWLLLSLFVVIFPTILLYPSVLKTFRFWFYLMFTEAFSVLMLSFLLYLACLKEARRVIYYGIPFGFVILIEFYLVPFLNARGLLLHLLFCYLAIWRLLPAVYAQWLEKEL